LVEIASGACAPLRNYIRYCPRGARPISGGQVLNNWAREAEITKLESIGEVEPLPAVFSGWLFSLFGAE